MSICTRVLTTLLAFGLLASVQVEARPKPNLTLADLKLRSNQTKLEDASYYLGRAKQATPAFVQAGGLVKVPDDVPTVLLPDLHAQRDYLVQALELKLNGISVYEGLKKGTLNVVCMGDAMHSEQRCLDRWLQAEKDVSQGLQSAAMEAEMAESLGLMAMIIDLKQAFPGRFYFVRGNHEDMNPEAPYRKFTNFGESNLVKKFVIQRWGVNFLNDWHQFELSLPLVAVGGSFVASHSPPGQVISEASVAKRTSQAFRACTWSDNPRWVTGGPEEQAFLENCKTFRVTSKRPWLCGHRKVDGALYRSQCDGRIIQINPNEPGNHKGPRVYIVAPAKNQEFRPARDVRQMN
jgi:hypothetical protein